MLKGLVDETVFFRMVSLESEMETLKGDEKYVHIGFRPTTTTMLLLLNKCRDLSIIILPSSYCLCLSNASKLFLEQRNIRIIQDKKIGLRRDRGVMGYEYTLNS